ncbi:hypothetical protein BDZ89DRAFT_1142112 [Hymenopellis radicata]|nr:hypothetical protein BDZ89DRAFT_1142112 [Hymenopellis radicata]
MPAQTPHQIAYHKDILANPDWVTAKKNPGQPFSIHDGKFGAVLMESPFIVTTPNATWIPNPSRSPNEILQLRDDYWYGPEDPLLWPQEDVPEAPWLPCLLRNFPKDGSLDNKLAILWDSLSPSQQFHEDLLRDLELVGQFRVDTLLPITYAKDVLVTSLPKSPIPPFWEGPRWGLQKITAITSAIERNQGSFASPANYSLSGAARPQAILPAASSSSRPTARPSTRGSPTKVIAYTTHTLLPAMVSTWLHVANVIDEQEYLQDCINKPAERYFVPRPDLFTNASQPKVASYMETWLRLRGIVLGCMGEGEPQALSHRAWQLWLDRGKLEIEVTQGGKTVKRKNKEKDEVDVLISAARKQGPVDLAPEAMWRDRKFDFDGMLGPHHSREILWELNELGFRFEMCMLDSTLTTLASHHEHYNRIRRCFPIGHAPLELADLGQANQGLAHSDWFSRAPFVYALHHVMRFWKNDVVHAARWLTDEQYFKIDEKRGLSPADFEDFEHKVIKIYISSFLTVYGRTPRIPMILSHQPHTKWKQPVYHRMAVGPNGVWMPERESDSLYNY